MLVWGSLRLVPIMVDILHCQMKVHVLVCRYLMKMKRFCRKKAMPCHQHGKQVSEVEGVVALVPVGVVTLAPLVTLRRLLPPLPPCGFSVTAVENNR